MKALIAAVLTLIAGATGTASAQNYPAHPVTMVVPYPAGGPSDTLARILADHMKTTLGQTIIVDNVSGAGGRIGVAKVARAAPDGYTLIIGHWNTHVVNPATQNFGFDALNDFAPVSLLADTPIWLVAKKSLPPKNLAEFLVWLKEQRGKATAGGVGIGGASDVTGAYFKEVTGTAYQMVPYKGAAPMNQDLVAGHIDFTLGMSASTFPLVRSGQIKAYATMTKQRWWAAPDVPTMEEEGVPGLYATFWHALWAPKGTPLDVIAKLNAAVQAALADPVVRKRFTDQGQEIPPRERQTPEALYAHHKAEIAKWWPIIKAAGIKIN